MHYSGQRVNKAGMPLCLSVITVNLNNRIGLEKTIRSVLEQSFSRWEHIIVDGGSDDGSLELAKKLGDERMRIICEKDEGIYDAMNKGIILAKGDFLIFLNSGDCLSNKEVLSRAFEFMGPSCNLLFGDVILQEKNRSTLMQQPKELTSHRFLSRTLCHQSCFFARRIFHENGLYDTSFRIAADYEFLLRVFFSGRLRYRHLDTVVCVYERGGVSDDPKNRDLLNAEKRVALRRAISFRRKISIILKEKIKIFFEIWRPGRIDKT